MNYDYHDIQFAMCTVGILKLIAVVALISYAAKSRLAFLVGGLGCCLGLLITQPIVYANYSSVEGAYLGSLTASNNHVLSYGIVGSVFGCGVVVAIRSIKHRYIIQFSIRTLLLVTTASAILIGIL